MRRYLEHWTSAYDEDRNGLAYWPGGSDQSGMDNQSKRCAGHSEGVDLNCYLVREYETMAIIAESLGKTADHDQWLAQAAAMRERINRILWRESDGFYYDRDESTGAVNDTKSVSCFTPLWTHVATPAQAKRLVEQHLTNPQEFWQQFPVSGYAKTDPTYYLGTRHGECNWCGNTWIPTNHMIIQGLRHYGYHAIAKELAYKTFAMAMQNPVTREYYNAETGEGYGCNPFYGWSTLAYLMPFEVEMSFDPTALNPHIVIPNLIKQLGVTPLEVPSPPPRLPNQPDRMVTSDGDAGAYNCVDGRLDTDFVCDKELPYDITMQWDHPRDFSSLMVAAAWCQGQAPTAWDIQVSPDGEQHWTTVASVDNTTWKANDQTVEQRVTTFTRVNNQRGLRLHIRATNREWKHFQIIELEAK